MKRLQCPTCGNEVFFDSLNCVRCLTGLAIELRGDGLIAVADVADDTPCANRATWGCNWPARGHHPVTGAAVCDSCQLVDAGGWANDGRMAPFQTAQRRALYQLGEFGIPTSGATTSLRFTYRSKDAGDPALIGHRGGEITLDIDEADPARGELIRATLGERYRTPLGHIRHELGHYVWQLLVEPDPVRLDAFRSLFGDERADYAAALDRHYARIDDLTWRERFVSFYASSHPWEDFAESWAQVMHVHDMVETGAAWGVVEAPAELGDTRAWLSTASGTGLAANELARAMGMSDLYPFALSPGARAKVAFCWGLLPAI
ncbi:MAG: putative zinc-binding metallopeptidase [Desertimonas sp.]